MSRRGVTLASAGLLVVVLSAIAALLPVPYVALSPGPTTNTLGNTGTSQATALIRIDGRRTYPDRGHLDLTTVSVLGGPRQKLDLVTALRGWLDRSIAIIPQEQVFPPGQTAAQVEKESTAEMRDSQENATTAALRSLGIPVTTRVRVAGLSKGSPSQGKVRKGDLVLAVDGTPVDGGAVLRQRITRHKPGDQVTLTVERDGERLSPTITTGQAQGHAIVGITTRDEADYPFTVDIGLQDVGGPSAGLMFALGIVDKLTPGSLTGGAYVAGTGTIDDQGDIGSIGGITQKMLGARRAGATIFLAPAGNCAEAAANVPDGLRLVKVPDLTSAVSSLNALRGHPKAAVPSCA
ncbi:MAG: Lon-like protease [Actinomycetota bacterium]|nr:Lon-like protease [Actinomycetota bacterium]